MMKKILKNIFTIILAGFVIQVKVVSAVDFNSQDIEPELLCLVSASYYERKYSIPKDLLRSISIVESGKWNNEHKMTFAWPWVIGVDGRGEYFKSYSDAVAFLRKAVARGQNVDIGCHQINWKYHGHHFSKPEELLHPKINAAYAAHFLVEKFNASKNWSKAVAHYHSHTPEFGDRYLKKVHVVLEGMKGKNAQKYSDYLKNKTSKLHQNHNLLYEAHAQATRRSNRHKTVFKSKTAIKTQDANQVSDIVVFSVELPANSAILNK
jgi:hypothetical protein